jgi:hypothetical protein
MKHPHERYDRDVQGMPAFAAVRDLEALLTPDNMRDYIAEDDENCAIALGCRRQFQTPYVSVGRSRTDIALPHPKGVEKPGYGSTKWAVIRYQNSPAARKVIIAADTGDLPDDESALVTLQPPKRSIRPALRRERNKQFREDKGVRDGRGKSQGRGQDTLSVMGVRSLTGQRR